MCNGVWACATACVRTVSGFSLVFSLLEAVPWHCVPGYLVCALLHVLLCPWCCVCSSFEHGFWGLQLSSSCSEGKPFTHRAVSSAPALFLISPIWHHIMFLPNVNTSSFHFQIFCLISLLMPSILPAISLTSRLLFLVPLLRLVLFTLCFSERPFVGVFKPPSCLLTAFYVPLDPYIVFLSFKFL